MSQLDLDSLLAGAKRSERSVPICLRGDLVAQLQELDRQLDEAEKAREAGGALNAGGAARALAEQIEALREEMKSSTVTFVVRALPRRRWTALLAEHPPRDGNQLDALFRVNFDTFFDVVVRECVAEPEMTEQQWAALDEVLSDGQWQTLANASWGANRRDVDVPFSPMASRVIQTSEPE